MGPDVGEANKGIPFWYYFWFPLLCCVRMAQPFVSIFSFIFHFILGSNYQVHISYCYYWKSVAFILAFIFEISNWFRWLIWISSIYIGYYLVEILVFPLVIFYTVYGYEEFFTKMSYDSSTRRNKRRNFQKFKAYDRRLLIFSEYMLYEYMAPFFSLRRLGNSYFWFPFHSHLVCQNLIHFYMWMLKIKPPWPPPGYISHLVNIGFFWGYFLSVILFTIMGSLKKLIFKKWINSLTALAMLLLIWLDS